MFLRIMETLWNCGQLDVVARIRCSKEANKNFTNLDRLERMSDWDVNMLLRLIEAPLSPVLQALKHRFATRAAPPLSTIGRMLVGG